jgi:hypothetical protein
MTNRGSRAPDLAGFQKIRSDFVDQDIPMLADQLGMRLDELVEAMLDRLWDDPGLEDFTRPEFRGTAAQIARASLTREIETLGRLELPRSCPPEDLAAARATVSFGAPVTVVLQCYRAGHAVLQSAWLDAVEKHEPDPLRRRALVDCGTEFMFSYVDRCSAWVQAEYARERERVLRSEEQRRTLLVRDILEGRAGDATGALGYELAAEHLGVVAWGAEPEATLHRLAGELDRRLLAVAVDPVTWWGWLGAEKPFDRSARKRLLRFDPPSGTAVAVGGPARGPDGFRGAHEEALQAQGIAVRTTSPLTIYETVALEALGAQNEAQARSFVTRELGSLGKRDRRTAVLRQTLRAYFSAGQTASSTAALLGVHERTVANRLHAVENRLGHPATARRAEVETALRLEEWLSGTADSSD